MMRERHTGDMSFCDRSRYCPRLLDDLVETGDTGWPGRLRPGERVILSSTRDWQDDRLIEQMREHVPGCPACSETLAYEQQLRAEQRSQLRSHLQKTESIVPSTTGRILDALHREQEQAEPTSYSRKRLEYMLPELIVPREPPYLDTHQSRTTGPLSLTPSSRWLRNGITLATIAALLFAVMSVFGQFLSRGPAALSVLATQVTKDDSFGLRSTMISHLPATVPAANGASPVSTSATDAYQGWNGFVMLTGAGAATAAISTYNYLNGDRRQVASINGNLRFDGVATSGQNMLYQVVTGEQTQFYTLNTLPGTGYFYALDAENALNAIWMPDSIHVLIATQYSGIIQVNSQTGEWQNYLPSLQTSGLKFYQDGNLYFLGGSDRNPDALYRINVASGEVRQVTGHVRGADFWLSPDNMTIYYRNNGPQGLSAIYAERSDGSKRSMVRSDGVPIGYAPDNSLVVMRVVHHTFQVVRLGATMQQDQVLMQDVAPGATSLCNPSLTIEVICDTTNVALAPLAHALVVIASYPDGSRKVWSDDLVSGRQLMLMTLTGAQSAIVPGWDRIAVA